MELNFQSSRIADMKQTISAIRQMISIIISMAIVLVHDLIIYRLFNTTIDHHMISFYAMSVILLLVSIIACNWILKNYGKKSRWWFLWDGPLLSVKTGDNETIEEIISWFDECLPGRVYYLIVHKNRMSVKFKDSSDVVLFRTSW